MSDHQELIKVIAEKPHLKELFLKVSEDQQLFRLLQELATVTDDHRPLNGKVTRRDILDRTERFIQCSKRPDEVDDTDHEGQPKEPTVFVPPLAKGQLIKAKFSAVGSELDREHFAIVWDVLPNRDSVQIIPTESMKNKIRETKHRFNIGKVRPLTVQTAVLLEQMTCISRKRIDQTEFTSRNIPAYLSDSQVKRIEEGFRVMLLNEESLLEHMLNNNFKFVPQFTDADKQLHHLLRPLASKKYDKKVLKYTLHNDPSEYELTWVKTTLGRSARNWAIRSLANVIDTEAKSREKMREELYNKMHETVV